ncbi:MAG: PD-(D/E)XK nuclease family protein, partial [Chloroflexota bacterium]
KKVLKGLLSAQILLTTLEDTGNVVTWSAFLADLQTAIEREAIERYPERHGRVLVTTATDARGLPHRHVFVMGLSEGLFPLRQSEDPLYLDSERRQMVTAGLQLNTAAMSAGDDGLFYELISLPRRRLYLSRPTVKDGSPWVRSHLWRAVEAVFEDAKDLVEAGKVDASDVVPAEQAATFDEVAIAVAAEMASPKAETPAYFNWLLARDRTTWARVLTAYDVESTRADAVEGRYNGRITDELLLDKVKTALSIQQHQWSASQLNDYGACPFRFFAGRLLWLRALEEPSIGMDARQLGTLNHDILQYTYRQLADEDVIIHADNLQHALKVLHTHAAEQFALAPHNLGIHLDKIILNKLFKTVEDDLTLLLPQWRGPKAKIMRS